LDNSIQFSDLILGRIWIVRGFIRSPHPRKSNVTTRREDLAKDGAIAFAPLVNLLILAISYLTRPANRQCQAIATLISSSQEG
jgi:hypothetical protein